MRYRKIPHTALQVSAICLGGGGFGSSLTRVESFRMLDAFVESGGTFIDTARVYAAWIPDGMGVSERTIGLWLKERRLAHDVVVATKGAHPDLVTMATPRMSPQEITLDCEDSLRALGMDTIALYWLHRDDPARPVADIVGAMEDLVKSGKIRYYGCSNWQPARLREAIHWAQTQGIHGFVANQPLWSLAKVNPGSIGDPTMQVMDAETFQLHKDTRIPVIPYTSQARGFFGKAHANGIHHLPTALLASYDNPENRGKLARLQELAKETGHSVAALALAWLIEQRDFVTIPIVSASHTAQLQESLQAVEIELSDLEMAHIG